MSSICVVWRRGDLNIAATPCGTRDAPNGLEQGPEGSHFVEPANLSRQTADGRRVGGGIYTSRHITHTDIDIHLPGEEIRTANGTAARGLRRYLSCCDFLCGFGDCGFGDCGFLVPVAFVRP